MPWLSLIKMFIDHKALLRGIAGVSSAVVALLIAQQLVEQKHSEAKAWFTEGETRMATRQDERYAEFKRELLNQQTDIKQIRGWLWELVQAKRTEGSAQPQNHSLKEGANHGR